MAFSTYLFSLFRPLRRTSCVVKDGILPRLLARSSQLDLSSNEYAARKAFRMLYDLESHSRLKFFVDKDNLRSYSQHRGRSTGIALLISTESR
jgi:hypothetical protein